MKNKQFIIKNKCQEVSKGFYGATCDDILALSSAAAHVVEFNDVGYDLFVLKDGSCIACNYNNNNVLSLYDSVREFTLDFYIVELADNANAALDTDNYDSHVADLDDAISDYNKQYNASLKLSNYLLYERRSNNIANDIKTVIMRLVCVLAAVLAINGVLSWIL